MPHSSSFQSWSLIVGDISRDTADIALTLLAMHFAIDRHAGMLTKEQHRDLWAGLLLKARSVPDTLADIPFSV